MEENNWLDDAILDLTIHRLKYRHWQSDEEIYRKWLRV